MRKKFIKLNEAEKITLQEGRKNGKAKAFQERCHYLPLNSEAHRVKELARIFPGFRVFVSAVGSSTLETGGIVGLKEKSGRGRGAIGKLRSWRERGGFGGARFCCSENGRLSKRSTTY